MTFERNTWKESNIELKASFEHPLRDRDRVISTPVSVIRAIKKIDSMEVSYMSSLFSLSNRDNLEDVCKNWGKNEKIKDSVSNFLPCPCSLVQAKRDPKYTDDVLCTSQDVTYFWRGQNCAATKGAYHCVISKLAM